jgi:YesN/AraC family two-component response regulator
VLTLVYFQKQRLNTAYTALFEKNLKIITLEEQIPQKRKRKALNNDVQKELLNKILSIMEDPAIICDPEFSLDKLAILTQSNYGYVSQVIKTELNQNFKSLLNTYRVREAQRLFSEPNVAQYTVENIGFKAGFKSRTNFYSAFKEITGVSPAFYLKSMMNVGGK